MSNNTKGEKNMKKTIIVFTSVCLLLSIVFVASGCGLFDSGESNGGKEETKYEFSIQYDDEITKYSFTNGNSVKVDPRYKVGYTLEGFYTKEGGEGTQMLDWKGNCLNKGFSGDGSTVLYPYYKAINYNYVFKGPVWYDEDPKTASYNVYGSPKIIHTTLSNLENIDYILKLASANPDMNFVLTAKALIYDEPGRFYVGIGKNVEEGNLLNYISFERPSSYTEMSVSTVIRGKAITIKDTQVLMGVFCSKFGHIIYFKNMQIEISIVQSN